MNGITVCCCVAVCTQGYRDHKITSWIPSTAKVFIFVWVSLRNSYLDKKHHCWSWIRLCDLVREAVWKQPGGNAAYPLKRNSLMVRTRGTYHLFTNLCLWLCIIKAGECNSQWIIVKLRVCDPHWPPYDIIIRGPAPAQRSSPWQFKCPI